MSRDFNGITADHALVEDFFTGDGWFPPFCVLNLFGVTALIATLEILVLNSVKRPVVRETPAIWQMIVLTKSMPACREPRLPARLFLGMVPRLGCNWSDPH